MQASDLKIPASRKKAWGAATAAVLIAAAILYVVAKPKDLTSITGAVLQQDPDLGRQLPIANAQIYLGDNLSDGTATSDASGLFHLKLRKGAYVGRMVTLYLRHSGYQPMDISEFLLDRLYVVRMVPASQNAGEFANTPVVLSDVRVRYTTRHQLSVDVGSASKTFEVVNTGDVPCAGREPCSPDGKWKAAIGGASLDAGESNQFHDVRVSCIAGPCPFTRIEKNSALEGGGRIDVAVRNWSDTVTFLIEAEVTHTSNSNAVLQSFPAVFGRSMSFTLPASAEGASIEATLNGEDIIFPLGPVLELSWAACNAKASAEGTKIYRCVLKPGYRFR